MTNSSYVFSLEDVEKMLNQGKECLLETLCNEGIISEEVSNKCLEYAILIHRKGKFGSFIDKLLFKNVPTDRIIIMKLAKNVQI